ncbi:MAG TPA: aminotransferase class IV [Galbitalea sp.]|jgi:branched-subunit amino acid aminotransferase/4-amino-4-deoxychorismate lyase
MSVETIFRWLDNELVALDYCDMADTTIAVADSWFVTEGTTLALGLHRDRFLESMPADARGRTNADAFWDAAIATIPRVGDWFPRVELQQRGDGVLLVFRLRSAPDRTNNVVVTTWQGDPRTQPRIKGPDVATMTRIRTSIQPSGAGEAVILADGGFVVDGAYSGLLWWRGEILCGPPAEFERVDSVSVRSVIAMASALGIETYGEPVTPSELDGTELWSLNALHGIRIVTSWLDGPSLAERPGRLATWRARMDALRKPI